MAQNLPIQLLTQFHEVAKRVAGGSLSADAVAATLQALIEKQPLDQSSLGTKVIATREGVEITEAFLAQTMEFNGQKLKRHRNGGGWVPAEQDEYDVDKPFVAASAYVGPFAVVAGNARVFDKVRISEDAYVSMNAQISGNVWVTGNARIGGDTRLSGSTVIS